MSEKAKIYFPGLNGLRFISAMLVVVTHVEFAKLLLGRPTIDLRSFFRYTGELGVTFFFVLSGFLITYLLLAEKKRTGKISIRKFYLRRILRIWPLYYLVFALAFLLLPGQEANGSVQAMFAEPGEWAYYAFFIPNVALILFNSFHFAVPLWSIGAEEQYYAFWPWMAKSGKKVIWWALAFIISFTLLKCLLFKEAEGTLSHYLFKFIYASRFDCMAIGALIACMLFTRQKRFLTIVFSRPVQIIIWALLISLLALGIEFSFMTNQVYGMIFGLIILNTGANPRRLVSFENPLLHYLGKISYGIYMFHSFAIAIIIGLFAALQLAGISNLVFNIALYSAVSLLTIGMASLSYHIYEKPFLLLKNRFRRISLSRKA